MKKFKKLSAMLSLVLCFSMIFSGSVFAMNYDDKQEIEEICQKYNLKDVEKLPKGIVPLEIKTADELEEYALEMQKQPVNNDIVVNSNSKLLGVMKEDSYETEQRQPLYTIHLVTLYTKENPSPTYPLPLHDKNWKFTSSSASCYLTGVSYNKEISNPNYLSTISSTGKVISSQATGTISYYVIIDGVIKYGDKPFSMSHRVTLP